MGMNTQAPAAPTAAPAQLTDREVRQLIDRIARMSPAQVWRTQANVRSVVGFVAQEVAHTGLHIYERRGETDRARSRDSNIARLLEKPNPAMTGYELINSLVSDYTLYDEAWLTFGQTRAGWYLRPLPVDAVSIVSGTEENGDLVIRYTGATGTTTITQKHLLHFKGWTPSYDQHGISKVHSVRDVLTETAASYEFRRSMWRNGGTMGAYISRPKDAPGWQDGARNRFLEGLRNFRLGGAKSGGMLLLEDGMSISQTRFNAREEQWLEANQVALETVCRIWHVTPAMLGATGGVSYANLREFRTMLYTETLAPIFRMIEDRLQSHLIPITDPGRTDLYAEFNVKAKLAADFIEAAAVLSSSVGGPWMTRDEARARENLPAMGGEATQLITPLNVTAGGQASPRDSAPKAAAPPRFKAEPEAEAEAEAEVEAAKFVAEPDSDSTKLADNTWQRFIRRQRAAVTSRLGAKADAEWWDEERWNTELAAELYPLAMKLTAQVSADALAAIGEEPSAYDAARTEKFLRAVAESRAALINGATRDAITEALADPGEDEDGNPLRTPAGVFDDAETTRGDVIKATLLTTLGAFAITETATQLSGGKATKTWRTNSARSRAEHAAIDGETVPVDEPFSNGAMWPGDPILGADGVAGCECTVDIDFP